MAVTEGKGIAIDLQLTNERQGCSRLPVELFEQTAMPSDQLTAIEGIVEAE